MTPDSSNILIPRTSFSFLIDAEIEQVIPVSFAIAQLFVHLMQDRLTFLFTETDIFSDTKYKITRISLRVA